MVEHQSVINLLYDMERYYPLKKEDSYLLKTSYTFDVSVPELFGWFVAGKKVVILNPGSEKSPKEITDAIIKNGVTHINFVPSMLHSFIEESRNNQTNDLQILKHMFVAGEVLKQEVVHDYYKTFKDGTLENLYGPTEATIFTTRYTASTHELNTSVSIGKPISNSQIYILNANNKLSPIGVSGELLIGGDGVARGYLNRPDLTAEKFIDNPYGEGRLYRTGDLARWLPDGNIEYIGRIDHQVKIRGFRIELGEIENQLLKIDGVKEAVVVAREDETKDKYLCAYLVSEEDTSTNELRQSLSESLPDYMIPTYFMELEELPLTPNGKLDRKALPEPEARLEQAYVAPRNEMEEILVSIWSEVLGKEKVGINDNFFELGGHSLRATVITSRIHKVLNVELPLKELFKAPTISGISDYISQAIKSEYANIRAVEEKEYYETSSAQKRMWLLQQFDQKSTGYNMPGVFRIEGNLDRDRLEHVFSELIKRHELLRTRFEMVEEVIVQRVEKNISFKIEYIENSSEQIEEVIRSFVRPFNLSKAPLLRVGLISINEACHYLMFDMHHIISDGVSISILAKEVTMLYGDQELEEQRIQYKDFSVWQNEYLKTERMKEQEKYWLDQFSDELSVLDLPLDYVRPMEQSYEGERIEFGLGIKLTEKLNDLTRQSDATLYMVLLSVVNILLSKYTGQIDILVGSPIAGRSHVDLENMFGMFVNTLVMRNHPEGSKRYIDFLKEVKETALRAYENQDYQFEDLVDQLDLHRDISRNPLFDVMFVLQNMEERDLELEGLRLIKYNTEQITAKFDLTFTAVEIDDEIIFSIEYGTKLFKKKTIERMIGHLSKLLNDITENPIMKLSELEMMSKTERNQVLYEFNETYVEYPKDKMIHQLFEEYVEKAPNDIALVFGEESMTYAELNKSSNQIGRLLIRKGVQEETIVSMMLERSPLMVATILGIWKACGAYLPLDVDYPKKRIIETLNDSKTKVLVTQSKYVFPELEEEFNGVIIKLDEGKWKNLSSRNLNPKTDMNSLAYVIYTSGSTGKPKGAMVEHQGMMNHIHAEIKEFNLSKESTIAQNASHCFDISVWQFFTPLVCGGRVAIYSNELILRMDQFISSFIQDKVNILEVVPSFLEVLLNQLASRKQPLPDLEYLMITGEEIKPKLVQRWFAQYPDIKVVNAYGPAEAADDIAQYTMEKAPDVMNIPIGKPLQNLNIYIVDEFMNLCPIGIKGEIAVSGVGVGRGYLNDSIKTAEVFMRDPFKVDEGLRLYKTGDLGRWLPDGNIEFLGRADHQVKIRGFRIELGEIESHILKFNDVKEVVVVARDDETGDKYLCAYLVSEEEISVNELKQQLSDVLPNYMIPSYFVRLERMPLTKNGKVDKNAFPKPNNRQEMEYVAPRSATEEILAWIWCDVLERERVGVYDNFFELGGHSLRATVVVSRIHKELNIELPLIELFRKPTIAGISEYLLNAKKSAYVAIEPVMKKEYYEVSSAQKRMWLLQQFDCEGTGYNMLAVLILDGNLDKDRLEDTFLNLIDHHELLRTTFDIVDNVIVQKVNESVGFEIEYTKTIEEKIEESIRDFVRPFDLRKAPLLRIGLIKTEDTRHYLLFDMHHIISDGVSISILTKDFITLYNGNELEEQRIQYKDFSVWQNAYLKSEKIKKQEKYWVEQFSSEIPILNLPLDYLRPNIQSFSGAKLEFTLNHELTEKLKSISKETGATLYMILLSAVNILLSKYTSQDDIIVGSLIAGRPHADVESMLGMFVNTLVLRSHPIGTKSYAEFLGEVKTLTLTAYENQDYQFEELVDKLNLHRDFSRNPLFDVMFVYQNMETSKLELEGLKITEYNTDQTPAKFDMTFTATEIEDEILFNIEYCINLFKHETIERLSIHFQNLIEAIAVDTDIMLGNIDILTKAERSKIVYEFNDTVMEYPRDKSITQLFEEQVERTPNHVALVFKNKEVTYRELNERINQLANLLRSSGISRNDIVAILGDRSIDMVIAIIGVLKSGAAYMPIDPRYPAERIEYMLENSEATVLLVESIVTKDFSYNGTIICLEDDQVYASECDTIDSINKMDDLAYVMYTSGSTGKPKGVMLKHRGVINLSIFYDRMFCFKENSRIVHMANVAFDAAVVEIFPPLIHGATIFILEKEKALDRNEFAQFIRLHEIQIAQFVPITLRELLSYDSKLDSLDKVLVAGDKLDDELKDKILSKGYQLTNHYGPTETTVDSIVAVCSKEKSTIGKPIANTRIYILDSYGNPAPIRVVGEIYIAGEGIAKGYINNPVLTTEKFILNPLGIKEIIYKTGDIGYWEMDGSITFLGRKDNQIKLRGYRIELEEIENQLLKHKAIEKAVVVSKQDDKGQLYLSAYFTAEIILELSQLKEHITKELPEYMVPTRFTQITEMPLTNSGKVDKKALPEDSDAFLSSVEYVPPTNQQEAKLVTIWEKTLGLTEVGIHHNFFDIGGHSLAAANLVSQIHKTMDISIPFPKILEHPTIAQLSKYIENVERSQYITIVPLEVAPYYPTSYAQKRMYVIWTMDKESIAYNMPAAIMLEGKIDIERLERAVQALVDHHEVLRTSFLLIDGEPMQKVHDQLQVDVLYHDLGRISIKDKINQVIQPFNLTEVPLFRIACIKINEGKQLLVFDIHHIIFDGLSTNILIQDLMDLYAGNDLKKLRIQYKDYATWHNQYLTLERMKVLSDFWIKQFQGFYETNLPETYANNNLREAKSTILTCTILDERLQKIDRFSQENGITKFTLMLGIFKLILMRILDQDRITVGIPVAGRQHDELEGMIGMFLNTLVSTTQIDKQKTFHNFILNFKDQINTIFSHQEYPFENLYEDVRQLIGYQGKSLFSIMFNYMPEEAVITLDNLTGTSYEFDEVTPKYGLSLYVIECKERINIRAVYKSSIENYIINNILDGFYEILDSIIDNSEILLRDIRLKTQSEMIYSYDFDEEFENNDLLE